MADKKISALTSLSPVDDDDLIVVVDVSDTTMAATGTTKKALKSELKGDKGDTGDAATVDVGTTTTGDAGTDASVVNSGTTSAAIFDFTIPRGDKGEKGDKGDTGLTGIDWQGAWSAGTYTVTQGVSHNGSSWIATTTTTEEPSISATDWDLIALKGTDGADGVMASVVAGTGISVDSTDPANPIVTADLSKVDTKPTDLKISTASKGGVFNGGFEIDDTKTDSGATSSYETTIVYEGLRSLKIAYTTTAADYVDLTDKWLIGNGKTYKVRFMGYASVAKSIKLNANGTSQTLGTFTITAGSWNVYEAVFTASGDYTSARFLGNDTTASNIYIDQLQLEEVVTDTTFTGKVAEKIRPVLQAVTSTDNIDQSLDPTGAYTNTYALTNAVNEGATHIQTFTPTKKYTTRIGVWVVAKGTGNWTLVVHDASNNILASKTITNASLTEGAFNYFDVPNIWTSGALHFHLYSSVADGTCKANTTDDLETASYIHNYAKKSENFTVISNGIKTDLKADKDGLLSNAIIDLDNGKYRFYSVSDLDATAGERCANVYSFSGSNLMTVSAIGRYTLTPGTNIIFKVNTIFPIKSMKVANTTGGVSGSETQTMAYSTDLINWIDLDTTLGANKTLSGNISNLTGNIVYIRHSSTVSTNYITTMNIEADIDTSSIPQGLFYPIGVNQFTETWKATGTVLSYVYRQAKYTNENGVVMPAIELNSGATGAGLAFGYIPLKIDNSQETTPAITILASSGVASDTVLDADGEYVALSSGATEGSVNYQVTITKNTLYLSSNAESVDSTQDPSHQGNFIVGVKQQGLTDRVKDIGEETEDIKKGLADTKQLIRNNSLILAYDAGTTDAYEVTIADFEGYKAGLALIFKANTANTDGATLNVNGMGAKAIVKGVSTALATNDILASMYCHCVFDGTNFVLLNPRTL